MKKVVISMMMTIFVCLFLSLNSFGQETVRLTNGEWPPYLSENFKQYGVISHIVAEAFSLEGIKVEYRFYPWKRSYEVAKDNEMDGSVIWAPTPERKKDFYFSDPVLSNKKVFFHLKSYPFEWKTVNDLKGIKIGVTRGYTYGDEFDKAVKEGRLQVDEVRSDELNFKKLLGGRFDGFPIEMDVGYYLINSKLTQEESKLITHHSLPIMETPLSLILSKKAEKNKRLLELFNRGLKRLKDSGKYDQYLDDSRQGKYKQ